MALNATANVTSAVGSAVVASTSLSPEIIYQIPLLGDALLWWSNFTSPYTFEWTLVLIVALIILKKIL